MAEMAQEYFLYGDHGSGWAENLEPVSGSIYVSTYLLHTSPRASSFALLQL